MFNMSMNLNSFGDANEAGPNKIIENQRVFAQARADEIADLEKSGTDRCATCAKNSL